MNELITKPFLESVNSFSESLVKDIVDAIRYYHGGTSNGSPQDAGISGSVEFTSPYFKDGSLFVDFKMDEHWYYLEYGRGPTRSAPVKKEFSKTLAGRLYASKWYRKTGADPRSWYKSRLKHPDKSKILSDYKKLEKSLAFAIARSIHKNGWKKYPHGSGFLSKTATPQKFDLLAENIAEILGQKIIIDLSNSILGKA